MKPKTIGMICGAVGILGMVPALRLGMELVAYFGSFAYMPLPMLASFGIAVYGLHKAESAE